MYLGDFRSGATVRFQWNSFNSSGASITRTTNGTISVYKDGGVTQTTTGVTDTEDFDGLTGVHDVAIATTDSFYVRGSSYTVVLSAATIDSQTVNAVLAHFSIEDRFVGEAVRATAQNGGASTIVLATTESATDDAVNGDFIRTKSGTGAGQQRQITDYVGSSRTATVDRAWLTTPDSTTVYERFPGSLAQTLPEVADAVWDEATAGHATAGTTGKALTDVLDDTGTSGVAVADGAITAAKIAADAIGASQMAAGAIDASALATDAVDEIRDGVWAKTGAAISGVPTETAAVLSKLDWLFGLSRNKRTQTSTTTTLRNDGDSGSLATSTVSDDGTTFTANKWA